MPHIALRALENDDRDAAFSAARASGSAWPRGTFADRLSFDAWADRDDVAAHTIVEDASVVGVAAAMDVEGDRATVSIVGELLRTVGNHGQVSTIAGHLS